jgi:hypothetical protein
MKLAFTSTSQEGSDSKVMTTRWTAGIKFLAKVEFVYLQPTFASALWSTPSSIQLVLAALSQM